MNAYSHVNSSYSLSTFSQSYGVNSLKVKALSINLGSNIANRKFKLKKINLFIIRKNFNISSYTKLLRLQIKKNLKFMIELKTNRGVRHRLGLPTRGQRTKTNGKTKKNFKI